MNKQFFKKTKAAAQILALMATSEKNAALLRMAKGLRSNMDLILKANTKDLKTAKLSPASMDRLTLNPKRVEDMALAMEYLASLPDPVGEIIEERKPANGLCVQKVRIPLGVIGFIYESRPNVTSDAAGLCLKSGNAVILKGGKEAHFSNQAISSVLKNVLSASGFPKDCIQVLPSDQRKFTLALLKATGEVDVIIPRGGESLMQWVAKNTKIPVLKHDKGVCHVFVDEHADFTMALDICINSKVQRPGVCNAAETFLIHESLRSDFLPKLLAALKKHDVQMRAPKDIAKLDPSIRLATAKDFGKEFLSLTVALKCVANLQEAIDHIESYGSHHTDAIVTTHAGHAAEFCRKVTSSTVLHNASTRLADGGELGLGAEIGISTTKLHAFGPMGLRDLTIGHFIVHGNGHIRS